MKQRFQVLVQLKPGLLDPQGKAVEGALPAMGWTNVSGVRVGKHLELTVEAESTPSAVLVRVRDEGPGIADEHLPVLWWWQLYLRQGKVVGGRESLRS